MTARIADLLALMLLPIGLIAACGWRPVAAIAMLMLSVAIAQSCLLAATNRGDRRRLTVTGLVVIGSLATMVIWRFVIGASTESMLSALDGITDLLYVSLEKGVQGWPLDVLLATIAPLVLLGRLFVHRTGLGSPVSNGSVTIPHAIGLHAVPTLVIGAILIATRAGFALPGLWAYLALAISAGICVSDADIRRRPLALVSILSESGSALGRLMVTAAAVGVVLMVLELTALPIDIARLLAAASGDAPLFAIPLTVTIAIVLSIIMPGFAAYLITESLFGPALRTVGVDQFTGQLLLLAVCAVASAFAARHAALADGRYAAAQSRSGAGNSSRAAV